MSYFIANDPDSLTLSVEVARALVAFAGDDETRPTISLGIECRGKALAATNGHAAVRFPCGYLVPELHGRVWPRSHVVEEIKIAKAKKQTQIVLRLANAQPACTQLPAIDQCMPDRGFGGSPCVAGEYLAQIETVVTACHGTAATRRKSGVQGAHLWSAKGDLDPIMWVVVDENGRDVMAQVLIMPINNRLSGPNFCNEGGEK